MKRSDFIEGKEVAKVKDPEIKSGQIWQALEEVDFNGQGKAVWQIRIGFKHPFNSLWKCRIQSITGGSFLNVGDASIEIGQDKYIIEKRKQTRIKLGQLYTDIEVNKIKELTKILSCEAIAKIYNVTSRTIRRYKLIKKMEDKK